MSVIVKGMEMPGCCEDCEGHLVGEWNEYDEMCDTCHFVLSEHPWEPKHKEIDGIDTSKSIPDWCPLRPLPEKHGPMIDCQALLEEARRLSGPFVDDGWSNQGVFALIARQSTIVEAEGDD